MPVPFDLTSTRARPRCIAGSTLLGKGREGEERRNRDGWRSAGWLMGWQPARPPHR